MSTYRDRAVVLRTKSIRDADRHYVMYTERHGKILLLAKGSRRAKSKMSPHLASFGIAEIMVAEGKIVDRLAGASLVESYRSILGSLRKTALAQGFALAVDALTKRELPDERVFHIIGEYLRVLDAMDDEPVRDRHTVFDAAILKLLDTLGFGLELDACVHCRGEVSAPGVRMSLHRGGVECPLCRAPSSLTVSPDTVAALRHFRLAPLSAPFLGNMTEQARREIVFLTDLRLGTYLEDRFDALRYVRAVA